HTISYDETLADPAGPSHFHTTLIPVADATHRIYRIVGVAHDVTDQRRTQEHYVRQQEHLEELVKERTKELSAVTTRLQEVFASTITLQDVTREREVERLKEDFVSTVSHELRTPLTAINGHLELVIDGDAGPINELQHRFLDIARVNTTRLATLINDVLDVEQ